MILARALKAATLILDDNGIDAYPYKGANASHASDKSGKLKFANRRAEAYWKFREALDPSEYQGSPIALPPDDPELIAELAAPTFKIARGGITITPKEDLIKKLGRSPDRADAVVMSWYKGPRAKTHIGEWRPDQRTGNIGGKRRPKVITNRQVRRRRR